jgi:hypothetical protein
MANPFRLLGVWPMVPFSYMCWKLVFPWSLRKKAWSTVWACLIAPTVEVTFLMNYVGDCLTSLAKPLADIAYGLCFFLSGEFLDPSLHGSKGVCESETFVNVSRVVMMFPYWLRFMQCLRRYYDSGKRHPSLLNALKYSISLAVLCFGIFNASFAKDNDLDDFRSIIWYLCYFVSSLYSWFWDITMDWSLIDQESCALRRRRMLPLAWYYYVAAISDLVLRFIWVYTLIPMGCVGCRHSEIGFTGLDQAALLLACIAEIVRRSVWSVFRLENEHINNTEEYRDVAYIPLHFDPPAASMKAPNKPTGKLYAEIAFYAAGLVVIAAVGVMNGGQKTRV